MASALRASIGGMAIATVLLAAGLTSAATTPDAVASWVRNALTLGRGHDGRGKSEPAVARYEMDTGGAFVLDRGGSQPLLRFDDSAEVWALSQSRGARGDILYSNDMGEPVLRATRLGGLTVFTDRRPGGSAAGLMGAAPPLRLPPLGRPVLLYQRLYQDSVRAGKAVRHLVSFEAPDADARSDAVIADAALVVAETVVELAARPTSRAAVSRIAKVAFVAAERPAAAFQRGLLLISVAPSRGFAGRPSSARVADALGAS